VNQEQVLALVDLATRISSTDKNKIVIEGMVMEEWLLGFAETQPQIFSAVVHRLVITIR
jgi:hypothetical protein